MIQVCEEENQILRNAVVKLATANNSGIGNRFFKLIKITTAKLK